MDLVGRDDLLAEIVARVEDHGRRLVNLVGPGGIGKTTLARAAHARLAGAPAAARLTVELARVDNPEAVPGSIAAQLDFPSFDVAVGSPELADVVVLIDNCEHVLDAAAAAIDALLTHCPTLVILATSRAPVSLPGESIVALAPLELPVAGAADNTRGALQLLCERALDNGVTITDEDLELAGELCRRLDGVPLAVELAAARLRTMSLTELCERLEQGVGLLSRQHHRGAARHRSVRDTIDWSIRLLDDADRVRFAQLGFCTDVFDVDLAAALLDLPTAETIEVIERLAEASLLIVERHEPRSGYRMLEPIRAVAVETLHADDTFTAVRERFTEHLHRYVLAVLEEASQRWSAELIPTFMARFDQLAVALRYCLDHDADPTRSQTLALVLWGAVHQGRVDDVATLTEAVIRRWAGTDTALGPHVAAVHAMGKLLGGDLDAAEQLAKAAMADTAEVGTDRSWLQRVLGLAARYRGDRAAAADLLEQAARAAAELGAVTYALECRTYRSQDIAALGRVEEALATLEAIAAESAARRSIINEIAARTFQAEILAGVRPTEGLPIARDALGVSEAIRYPFGIAGNLQTITRCQLAVGDVSGAAATALRLVDAYARAGVGEFRRALDIATAVLHCAAHPAAVDLVASSHQLPDTHPMVFELDLPPVVASARLDRLAVTVLARSALTSLVERTTRPSEVRADPASAVFRRAGDLWEIGFSGATVHIAHTKGMEDLAVLLAQPGREIHCVELAGATVDQADTGEVIDATARRQYENRIRELQAEIDEAEANNDHARVEAAQTEFNAIVEHLTAALGLSGKARRSGGSAERARSTVTHRMRTAVRRIADANPQAGRHLEHSLTTGVYCRYQPEQPVTWLLAPETDRAV
jgi:predicted ATPase